MAQLKSGTRVYGTATIDTTIILNGTSVAVSTTTGALVVNGGAGIGGNLYVGGTVSVLNTFTVNKLFYQSVGYFAPASTATLTLNVANGTMQKFTLTNASTSITMPSASPGANFMLMLSQDNTGGRLVSSWSSVLWPSGTTATLTTTANKTDIFSFFSDGTSWYGITVAQNF